MQRTIQAESSRVTHIERLHKWSDAPTEKTLRLARQILVGACVQLARHYACRVEEHSSPTERTNETLKRAGSLFSTVTASIMPKSGAKVG